MIYVAIQRLRAALRSWIDDDAVERIDETHYRIAASLQPAIRRTLPVFGATNEGRRPSAVARWQKAIERATGRSGDSVKGLRAAQPVEASTHPAPALAPSEGGGPPARDRARSSSKPTDPSTARRRVAKKDVR
jgi:hypothetical protein